MTIFRRNVTSFQIALLGISLLLLMIFLQGFFFYKQYSKAEESRRWVAHTYEALGAIRTPFAKIKDAQIAQRGYILTGNEEFLEPYYAALGDARAGESTKRMGYLNLDGFSKNIDELRLLLKDNPEQQASLNRLEILLQEEMDFVSLSIDAYKKSPAKAVEMIKSGHGQKLMNEIRAIITVMMDRESTLLKARLAKDKQVEEAFTWLILITALITYSGLLAAIFIITRYFGHIRRVEQELRAKETYFIAAAEGGIDSFFIFSSVKDKNNKVQDLKLEYMNGIAERMLDVPFAKLKGKNLEHVLSYSKNTTAETRQIYLDVLDSKKVREIEYTISQGASGDHFYQEQLVPLPDGVAISCRDITDRKTMERMKNEFVSMVSHELRTPLTSIRAALGLVIGEYQKSLPGDSEELLSIAHNNCERLVRLINDILDIEKIESGKMVFDLRPIPLAITMNQSIDANLGFASKYNVKLALEIANDLEEDLHIFADPDRFMQVITNLISNAIKFSPADDEVKVTCTKQNNLINIAVKDNGTGIPEEFRDRIFQKFAQADSSDKRQKGGTGLGLSIVKAMVEEMGGEIGFDSEIGKGTSFYFTIPVAKKQEQVIAVTKSDSASRSRILVCEDEEDIANLLSMILERAGFAVDIALNAASAFNLLHEHDYVAMTLDLMLPDKSGVTLIHELRAEEKFINLPIIVISAKAAEGQKLMNGDAINIVDWMHKPIDVQRLVHLVHGLGIEHRPNILHVEDDIDITKVLGMALSKAADITSAPSLNEARRLLNERVFDLVVLDIGLPDGSGIELLPLLGSEGSNPTPVILFTAAEVSKEVSAKVSATLTKSRTSEEKLLETIRHLIVHGAQLPPTEKKS